MTKIQRCPNCNRPMQKYKRGIRNNMTKALFILDRVWPEGKKVAEMKNQLAMGAITDFPKMRYWGLIEEIDKTIWRITERGKLFIRGEIKIPRYVWVFNKQKVDPPEDFEDEFVNIRELGYEPINKEIAIQNSVPVDNQPHLPI